MKLKLHRRFFGEKYTIGTLYIDNKYFCDTLEDRVRNLDTEAKIKHQTAIPTGTYGVIVNLSPRFNRELPRLLEVPHFEGILIHRGNTHEDTSGCILVGQNKVKGKVVNSTVTEIELVEILKKAINNGENVTITVE